MSYRLVLLGSSHENDIAYSDNMSPVTFQEDGGRRWLPDIGQCMVVRACSDPATFEREFLGGTGLSAADFAVNYIYSAEYLYAPMDPSAFADALSRIKDNARKSDWCINALFHIKT